MGVWETSSPAVVVVAVLAAIGLAWWITRVSQARRAERGKARILESVSDAFVALDRDWRYTYVNAKAGEIFGRSPRDLIGKHIWTEFPEGVGQPFHLAYERALRDQTPARLEEYYPPYDRWFENRIYPSAEGLSIYFTDITERKRAEQAVAQERDFSSAVLDSLPGVFYLIDETLRFRRWNRNFERVTGYSGAEIATMAALDFVGEAEKEKVVARIKDVFTLGETSLEAQFRAKDGSQTPYFFTGVRTEVGGEVCLLGVGIDISARKQAEAAVRASEERLARLVEAIPDGIVVADPAGAITFANATAERILGLTRADIAGRRYNDAAWHITTVDGQPMADEQLPFARAMRTGQAVYGVEHAVETGQGRSVVLSVNAVPLRAADGLITGVVAAVTDITARRESEMALLATTKFLTESQRVAQVGAWSRDLVSGDFKWSAETYRILGVPETFAVSDASFLDLIHPEDRAAMAECIQACMAGEGPPPLEFRVIDDRGVTRVIEGQGVAEYDQSGNVIGVLGTLRDVTRQKESEQRLQEHAAALRALTERVQTIREEEGKRIARELHDELGQALTALRIDLSSIDKYLARAAEAAAAPVREKIASMARQIDDTVQAVRRISSELRPSILDDLGLAAAIAWQADEFRSRTGIPSITSLPGDDVTIPPEQATALYRILLEALTNIARHAHATTVEIALTREHGQLILTVSDDGVGISHRAATAQSLGILGMRERAEALGGGVTVSPGPGRGTVVRAVLPVRD